MTVSYDPLLDTNTDDPYELYRQFRRERPVYYNEERNLWALFDYEDVMATLPDWKRFSNQWQDNDPKIFLESDPPVTRSSAPSSRIRSGRSRCSGSKPTSAPGPWRCSRSARAVGAST